MEEDAPGSQVRESLAQHGLVRTGGEAVGFGGAGAPGAPSAGWQAAWLGEGTERSQGSGPQPMELERSVCRASGARWGVVGAGAALGWGGGRVLGRAGTGSRGRGGGGAWEEGSGGRGGCGGGGLWAGQAGGVEPPLALPHPGPWVESPNAPGRLLLLGSRWPLWREGPQLCPHLASHLTCPPSLRLLPRGKFLVGFKSLLTETPKISMIFF